MEGTRRTNLLYSFLQCLLLISTTLAQTPLVHDPVLPSNGTEVVSDKAVLLPGHHLLIGKHKVNDGTQPTSKSNITSDEEYTDPATVPGREKADIENKPQVKIQAATLLHSPYVMKGPGSSLVGVVPDILRHLQERLGITISLYVVTDGKYGTRDVNGTWDGIMGELIKRKNGDASGADMGAVPMLVTSERQKIVSFLNPFKHGGLVGVMKKPHMDDKQRHIVDSYFSILRPLSSGVWFSLLTGCLVVALLLWLLNIFDPYEWGGRYRLGRSTEAAAESFSFTGSLWFAFTTLQWQGFDRMPRSSAAKLLSTFWFVFVSVAIMMYTASVVNHLLWASTLHGRDLTATPFIDLEHLATAHDELGYDYGMNINGPVYNYMTKMMAMKMGRDTEYDAMMKYWSNKGKDNLVVDTYHGIQRARQGKFVFLTERMTAEFYTNQRPCDLIMIDKPIGLRSYALAVSKTMDKTIVEGMRTVIMELVESGEIEVLEKHWTQEYSTCWNVTTAEEDMSTLSTILPTTPKQVTLSMFWAPLTALAVGMGLSVLVFIAEAFYYRYKGRYTRQNRNGGHRLGSGEGEAGDCEITGD